KDGHNRGMGPDHPPLGRGHGQVARSPLQHEGPVNAVAVSPDGKLLLTGSGNWVLGNEHRLWDLATGRLRQRNGHTAADTLLLDEGEEHPHLPPPDAPPQLVVVACCPRRSMVR